jgi:hypothetical protein
MYNTYLLAMLGSTYRWSEGKNAELRAERGLSFEAVENAIEDGQLLDDISHPNPNKFPGQRMLIVRIGDQVCVVPYVVDGEVRFLKTIYPSRKAKRTYSGAYR